MSVLTSVRAKLLEKGFDAFIVGSGDSHQSEYVSEFDERRAYVSNFTGSAGTALVTKEKALLWTDGRYYLQASQELSADWDLMRAGMPQVPEIDQWILDNLPSGSIVGVDAFLVSTQQAKSLQKKFDSKSITLKAIDVNPIDEVWNLSGNRPAAPGAPMRVHDISLAGQRYEDKVAKVQEYLAKQNADAFVVTMLDEIAWLFNIRGSDIAYNPVVISYAVVTREKAYIFVDSKKLTEECIAHLATGSVEIRNYADIEAFLHELSSSGKVVVTDPAQINWRLHQAVETNVIDDSSPITLMKSLKNESELNGIRAAHVRDGAALTAFLHWLEVNVRANPGQLTEMDVVAKIEEFRGKMEKHMGPSFSTIAGYGPNGAIIHYKPSHESAAKLFTDSLFLLDSGAQYLDGTTDVTRTVAFGEVDQRMKDCYTLVLKGHINLARVVFPDGTLGTKLDPLARLPLWSFGLDYNHGTGHGVGAFLNVHEGPQGISFRKKDNEIGFAAGMTTSNEPGYYEDGKFGIRIENICITVPAATENNFQGKKFLRFEDATLVPIKTSLVNTKLLDEPDIAWLNAYHARVRSSLESVMREHFPESVDYLYHETQPISK